MKVKVICKKCNRIAYMKVTTMKEARKLKNESKIGNLICGECYSKNLRKVVRSVNRLLTYDMREKSLADMLNTEKGVI